MTGYFPAIRHIPARYHARPPHENGLSAYGTTGMKKRPFP
ncbi:hypothetical protein SXCC_01005 [Gluconacetobacter sp. SXCC-1]|nr:hypothetical protein SXCC_01005 [Gluconacetobacter sp. SXCC-1]